MVAVGIGGGGFLHSAAATEIHVSDGFGEAGGDGDGLMGFWGF